jgi:hypothetical protein
MTMRYLFLLQRDGDDLPAAGTADGDRLVAEYGSAVAAMARAGVLVECAPLTGASTATTVRVRDGKVQLVDGPAAELREQIGGFAVVECADLDEALRWAATLPAASETSVEVRAIIDTGRSR